MIEKSLYICEDDCNRIDFSKLEDVLSSYQRLRFLLADNQITVSVYTSHTQEMQIVYIKGRAANIIYSGNEDKVEELSKKIDEALGFNDIEIKNMDDPNLGSISHIQETPLHIPASREKETLL